MTVKGILIDPFTDSVTEVEYVDYKCIYKHIQCDSFDAAGLSNGDTAWVDDNGLSVPGQQFFWIEDLYPYPLAGRGLILGVDEEGESIAPKLKLDEVKPVFMVPTPFGFLTDNSDIIPFSRFE